jgi:hypothetical protein
VSPPQVLSTSSEEDREFLGTLSMFWFGRPIDPDLVYAASSNVYGTPSEDMAVVIFSLYYRDTKEAEKAGRFLQSMYSESTSHTIGQYDKLVIGFACLSEESRGCFQLLQSHIERLATKLMEESTASTS